MLKLEVGKQASQLLCRASGSCADDAWAPDMEAVKEGDEEGSPEKKTLAEMSALSFRPAVPSSPPATLTQVSLLLVFHNRITIAMLRCDMHFAD